MDIDREKLAWAGGLFEGEGSICWVKIKNRNPKLPPWMKCEMSLHSTDEDTVIKFAKIIGIGKVYGPYHYPTKTCPNRKPSWYWGVQHFEDVQFVVCLLWHWLGIRRKTKSKEVLLAELAERPAGRGPKRDLTSGRYK